MIAVLPPALALLVCALFLAEAVTRRRFGAKDRLQLLLAGLTGGVLLFIVQRVADWSERWLVPLWWLALVVLALGAAASVIRWPTLPWLRDPSHAVRRRIVFVLDVLVLAGVALLVA